MKSVFITGASGYVGSYLVRDLVSKGYCVNVLVRKNSNLSTLQEIKTKIKIHEFSGNTLELINLFELVKPEIVYHVASMFVSNHVSDQLNDIIDSNVLFGTQLLEAMKVSKCSKMVNIGTSWQHYDNSMYNPVCLYAASKKAFADIIEYYTQAEGLDVITLELYDTYGRVDKRKKLLPKLKEIASSGEIINMSGGKQKIELVHIDDLISAIVRAGEIVDLSSGHQIYDIGSKEPITLIELVKLIECQSKMTLNVKFGLREYRPREVFVPWNKYRDLPGWSPKIKLSDGIKSYFDEDGLNDGL